MTPAVPFLTALDARAAVKGSRDPLGTQPIWTRLGRQVVGNLTTVSTSVRDFSVLLLGYHFVEVLAEEGQGESDLVTFLKWEQMASYARAGVGNETGFRGTERVHQRLDEAVPLGTSPGAEILSSQRTYGLWGLFTVPAKASGLIEGEPSRLTSAGREAVEALLTSMQGSQSRAVRQIVERLVRRDAKLDPRPGGKDRAMLAAIWKCLEPRPTGRLRELYQEHLLAGGPADLEGHRATRGRQRLFSALLAEPSATGFVPTASKVRAVASLARRAHGEPGASLAEKLEDIIAAERVLAPAVAFFEYLLACHGRAPRAIADDVASTWGAQLSSTIDIDAFERLTPSLASSVGDDASKARWLAVARALRSGNFADCVELLLAQNADVMKARGGIGAWARLDDGKLNVLLPDERQYLPEANALEDYWRHAYFLSALHTMTRQLVTTP